MIEVWINGEKRQLEPGLTVALLLDELGVSRGTVLVEHNGAVLERSVIGQITVEDGDRLELIRFVGGG